MTVDTDAQPAFPNPVTFVFTVPGHQQWTMRTVRAQAGRVPGGIPTRAFLLTVANGQNAVGLYGADDAGTEPGTCEVTWADAPKGTTTAGPFGVSVAPFSNLVIPAGYTLTGTIVNPQAGDGWIDAVAWFDYTLTG